MKNRQDAQDFLKLDLGFFDPEIAKPSSNNPLSPGDKATFNQQLQNNKVKVDQFFDAHLNGDITFLNNLITEPSRGDAQDQATARTIASDVDLQVLLLDFNNQYGIIGVDGGSTGTTDRIPLRFIKGENIKYENAQIWRFTDPAGYSMEYNKITGDMTATLQDQTVRTTIVAAGDRVSYRDYANGQFIGSTETVRMGGGEAYTSYYNAANQLTGGQVTYTAQSGDTVAGVAARMGITPQKFLEFNLDGGAGIDVMIGGLGDDRYGVDNAGDVVTELANQGNDVVYSYILGANVEHLVLVGTAAISSCVMPWPPWCRPLLDN